MQKIKDFWSASLRSDPRAFALEITSFFFTVIASIWMAITADQPNMAIIYPIFFVGSLAGCWGYYRRQLLWPVLLTGYFMIVNVFGFGRALAWW
jgi:hypothetical protein